MAEVAPANKTVYVVAIARHRGQAVTPADARGLHDERSSTPPSLKAGMRTCFWRVFSRAWELQGNPAELEWYGQRLRLLRSFVFRVGGPDDLGVRGHTYVAVAEIVSVDDVDSREAVARIRQQARAELEIDLYETFFSALGDSSLAKTMLSVDRDRSDNKPALKFFHPEVAAPATNEPLTQAQAAVAPYLVAFYYFAMVLIFRIERLQWSVPIETGAHYLDDAAMERIAANRVYLIDFDRDFLTMNRSASPEVRELAEAIDASTNIRAQYVREVELNSSMEQHLGNVTQILQTRSARTSGRALTLLTVLGLPFTIFGAILTYWIGFYATVNLGLDSSRFLAVVLVCMLTPAIIWGLVWMIERWDRRRGQTCERG